MKFQLRLVAGLWLGSLLVVGAFAYFQFVEDRQRLTGELDRRAALVSEGLKEVLEPALGPRVSKPQIERLIKKFSKPDLGLAVYDRVASLIVATPDVTKQLENPPPEATWALTSGAVQTGFRKVGRTMRYVYADPILREDKPSGALVIFLDASDLQTAEWELWRLNAIRFVVLAVALALIALLVVRMSLTQPLAKMARWTKAVRRGHAIEPPELPDESLFGPIAREVTVLAKNLQRARAAAEEEAALRLIGQTLWTEERLKQFAKMRLGERPLVVVSNREPVSHVWKEGQIQVVTPASGLVTAMDPVMRACGGVWVAQASGDADRETADARGRLRVPPDDPRFTLKRVWLTPEEEAGYYYGFSNEGLWPLCHIVHNRPLFRPEDWAQYRAVNEKFAAAVLEEIAGTESPMVLIQDYHFALLPSLIKRERPDARTAIFWHIPWPNFEAFGICPWQDDILLGMLGADLVGFHTQFHCNNFLETVERTIEGRVEWDDFAVVRGHHTTQVMPFPISVATETEETAPVSANDLLPELETPIEFLGVGVERIDYTKGLPERFRAIRRFFERWPEYRRRVVFVQIASPSRSRIPRYQLLQQEIHEIVRRINDDIGEYDWQPIIYRDRHHDHREIRSWYRGAHFCVVSSLHDGMNLVAKEFIAARDNDDAVLILSRFTGASRELRDALLVNPYDIEGTAEAIHRALEMPASERRDRMARMRVLVREQNIFRWAGMLMSELARIPRGAPERQGARDKLV